MTVSTTPDAARIKEQIEISMNFVNYLKQNGWISDNSPGASALEECWIDIWNEYVAVREAIEGVEIKDQLFKWVLGSKNINHLLPGDCINNGNQDGQYMLVDRNNAGEIKWSRRYANGNIATSPVFEKWLDDPIKSNWKYLGRNLWTP